MSMTDLQKIATRAWSQLHQREATHCSHLQGVCNWLCIGKGPTFFRSRSQSSRSHEEVLDGICASSLIG